MLRIGFIGSGGRAVREMLDLVQIPEVAIAALCDISEERIDQALAQLQGRTSARLSPAKFTDYRSMLDGVELDAVYVSLPPFAHGAVEHAVIDARRALFVEKPLAADMGVAREIDAHIKDKGIINAVGYQWRYAEPFARARDALRQVPIGLVIAIRLGPLPPAAWWRRQAQSGGMLVEQHTHSVDIMRFIAGDVASVYAA
ncbi:MAG: Gfo/Idh/MocA family oxidoreductase, partial [Chloroflexi bacterium]|nr:Gfo/Idh/MocA family oxidoreductase [Chloroflexota bacterium]